jgi:microsomal dipeptidase-like Zn-dependent dipeptidase
VEKLVITNNELLLIMFRVPVGLEDVSRYPYLFAELLESDRWTEEDLAKLAGRNLIRVFKQVEQVSIGN